MYIFICGAVGFWHRVSGTVNYHAEISYVEWCLILHSAEIGISNHDCLIEGLLSLVHNVVIRRVGQAVIFHTMSVSMPSRWNTDRICQRLDLALPLLLEAQESEILKPKKTEQLTRLLKHRIRRSCNLLNHGSARQIGRHFQARRHVESAKKKHQQRHS